MKPGRITCAGLVGVMMVLPSSLWKKESPRRAIHRVVIREASVEAAEPSVPEPVEPARRH
jgi:hypothetical protein